MRKCPPQMVFKDERKRLHREDGPAIVFPNGPNQWWLYGKQYNCIEWMLRTYEMNSK